jgi:hypothetical protein
MKKYLLALSVLALVLGSGCQRFSESTFMSSLENQDWLQGRPEGPFAPEQVVLKAQTAEAGYDGARRTFVKSIKLSNDNTFDLTRDMYRGAQKAIQSHGGAITAPISGDEKGDFHIDYDIDNNKGILEFYFAQSKDNVVKAIVISEERPRRMFVY